MARTGTLKVVSFTGPEGDDWKARKQDSSSVSLQMALGLSLSMGPLPMIHAYDVWILCMVGRAHKTAMLETANPLGLHLDLVHHHSAISC